MPVSDPPEPTAKPADGENYSIINTRTYGALGKICRNAFYAALTCKRNIEMTPLCKIEVTHPRVLTETDNRDDAVSVAGL